MQHPNILPLYDPDGTDDVLYHVMPFVEGQSLRDVRAKYERVTSEPRRE